MSLKKVIKTVESWVCGDATYPTKEEAVCADLCTFEDDTRKLLSDVLNAKNSMEVAALLRRQKLVVQKILSHGESFSWAPTDNNFDRIVSILEQAWKCGYDSYRRINPQLNTSLWEPIPMIEGETTKFINDNNLLPFVNMAIKDGFRVATENMQQNITTIDKNSVLINCYACANALFNNWKTLYGTK